MNQKNPPIPSNLLTFFHNYNTLNLTFNKLRTILSIEAFEKLHKIFSRKKAQILKFFIIKLKRNAIKPAKWLKQLIVQSLQHIDNLMDFKNTLFLKEILQKLFYLSQKKLINKHLNYKQLNFKEKDYEISKNSKDVRSFEKDFETIKRKSINPEKELKKTNNFLRSLIKIHCFQKKKNDLRNSLMKCFNRWNYL